MNNNNRQKIVQCVWLVRYGLTEHALVEDVGPYDSDIDPKEGMKHAKSIAQRIAKGYNFDCNSDIIDVRETIPKVVYADPFMRTTHTGHIIAKELSSSSLCDNDDVQLRSEEGLWEWLIPSLLIEKSTGIHTHPKSVNELKKIFDSTAGNNIIDEEYKSVNPYKEIMSSSSSYFPESEKQLLKRCGHTLSRILELKEKDSDAHEQYESICIVSHAPCNQAMAYYLAGDDEIATSPEVSSTIVKPWPLGGITMFSRTIIIENEKEGAMSGDSISHIVGKWKCEIFGNTHHMPNEYKKGIAAWSLPSFDETVL